MKAKSLRLKCFRNYEELDLSLSPNINVFLGENAQGKTNIAEALYYAAIGRSHRTNADADLIAWDAPAAKIGLLFERLDVENTLEIGCTSDVPMVRGISQKNTPAQNYAAIAMMTINANARLRGEEVQDVPEIKQ